MFPKIDMNLSCNGEGKIVSTSIGYYARYDPSSAEKHLEMTIEAKFIYNTNSYTLHPDRVGLFKVFTMIGTKII